MQSVRVCVAVLQHVVNVSVCSCVCSAEVCSQCVCVFAVLKYAVSVFVCLQC